MRIMRKNLFVLFVIVGLSIVGVYLFSSLMAPPPAPRVSVFVSSATKLPNDKGTAVISKRVGTAVLEPASGLDRDNGPTPAGPAAPESVPVAVGSPNPDVAATPTSSVVSESTLEPRGGGHNPIVEEWKEGLASVVIKDLEGAFSTYGMDGEISGSLVGQMDVVLSPSDGESKAYRGYAFSSTEEGFLILVIPAKDAVQGPNEIPLP
jgi:hypothetical protein